MIVHNITDEERKSLIDSLDEKEEQAYLLRKDGKLGTIEYHMIWTSFEKKKRDLMNLKSISINSINTVNNFQPTSNENKNMVRKIKK